MVAELEHGVGKRRTAWRFIASAEQKENFVDNEQPATYATEYVAKVEAEFPEVRDGIFELMDKNFIALASTGDSKELFSKMKGSHCRYAERVMATPVPQPMEEIMEVIRLVPQERNRERIVEETIDVLVLHGMKEIVEAWKYIPQEHVQNCTGEHAVEVPVRVIKMNLAKKYLETLAESTEKKDDCEKSYEQFVKCMKLEIAELLRFNMSKPGDEQINFKEYVDRMKEGQNDIYYITGKSIAVVSSSLFWEHLRKKGHEVLYMADSVDEFAVQQLKEFDGKTVKCTPEDRFDLGDHEEKNKLEELKAELKSLMKLLKGVGGDQFEKVSDRIVDLPCVLTTSKYGWSANMQRITQQLDSSQQQQQDNQPQVARQPTRQERGKEGGERKKERKGEGERGRSEQEEKGREERESVRKGEREKEEGREAEGEECKQVEKDATGWTVVTRNKRQRKMAQIFVKVNGSKVTPMEVNLTDDKVEDVMRQIQKDEDVYVTMNGKVLRRDEKLKSCGVSDGCTIQVTSRMRGGGRHKDKKGQKERKRAAKPKGPEQKSEKNRRETKVQ